MVDEVAPVSDEPAIPNEQEAVAAASTAAAKRFTRASAPQHQEPETLLEKPASQEEYDALKPGTRFIDPEGGRRVKPWEPEDAHAMEQLPEGSQFRDPEGVTRTTPRYEGVDYTADTLYGMAANDKERRKALERSYPGKVKESPTGRLYVEEEDGKLRRPKGSLAAWTSSQVAPVVGAIGGEVGGGLLGAAGGPPGVLAGAIGGGAAGGAAGQLFNDAIMQLAGVYDRSLGEEAGGVALAGAFGGGGAAVGRLVAGGQASARGLGKGGAPSRGTAGFLGAEQEGLETAIGLSDKGVLVPPSGWAKESPALINIAEVYDPAFRTQKPMLQSATEHYEKTAGGILKDLGVAEPGSLTKPTAAVSTEEAGNLLLARARERSSLADMKLQAEMQARMQPMQDVLRTEKAIVDVRGDSLVRAEIESKKAAQELIEAGFTEIQGNIDKAMATAKAGHNSGDLWWNVGEQLRLVKQGIQTRARTMYEHADALAGDTRPNIEGLSEKAAQFLAQLPEGFEGKYPSTIKSIRDMAGVQNEAGAWVKEPVAPTFGQLHNMRSVLRSNYNSFDLSPDIKQGSFKFFANRVDEILQNPGAAPNLQEASRALRLADDFYRESMGPLTDKNIQAVMNGLESGLPADPKNLYTTVVKEGRSDLTRKVADLVGPNLWAGVRAADVQEMIDMSRTLTGGIDGAAFARQVLDRHRSNMLEAVHGKAMSSKLIEQANRVAALNGKLDIEHLPNDTVKDIIARALTASEAVKQEAKANPLGVLQKEMQQIHNDWQKQAAKMRKDRRAEPLGFLYEPTTGAAKAVNHILESEDLIIAAASQYGMKSPEFEMLRQIWAQRMFRKSMQPSEFLEKTSSEVQQLMFPGVTMDQMTVLAKEMDFLMGSKGVQETAKSMAAQNKVNHPWSSIGPGRGGAVAKLVTTPLVPFNTAGRAILGKFYKMVTEFSSNPAFLRWVLKGLKGDPAAREAVKQDVQAAMSRGGWMGAGAGESAYSQPNLPESIDPWKAAPEPQAPTPVMTQ